MGKPFQENQLLASVRQLLDIAGVTERETTLVMKALQIIVSKQ